MDLALLVYGISILHSINNLLVAIIIASAMISGIAIFVYLCFRLDEPSKYDYMDKPKPEVEKSWNDKKDFVARIVKFSVPIFFMVSIISILLPSEKTAYIMVGAYTAQKVAENPEVQKLSGKVLTIIENKLDTYVDEAEKKIKEKTK